MRLIGLLLLVITYISSINAQGGAGKCTFEGKDYSPLSNQSYSATDSQNQYTYYFGICKVASKCNGGIIGGNVVACQSKNGGSASPQTIGLIGQGSFSSTTENGANVLLNYKTIANPCSDGTFRNIDIYIKCGSSNSISEVAEEKKCTYGVTVTSNLCGGGGGGSSEGGNGGKKSGMGGGWIFIIILISVTGAYLIGGVIYNAKVKGLRGSEMLPNRELWGNFGGLVKDGVFFIKSKVSGTPSGYQQV